MNGRWVAVLSVLALAACDGGGGMDAGGGGDAGSTDAGSSDGGGGGDAGVDASVGPTRPLGAACDNDGQCQSGVCFNATAGLELGTGYCTLDCAASSACDGFPSDGYEYGCVAVADGLRCARLCPDGFGCGEDDLCVTDFGSPEADICLDLSNDLCTSNADCAGGVNDICTVLTDRDSAVVACFHARQFGGEPVPFKAVGDTCNPLPETPCTTTADCPTGFRCQRGDDGRDRCNPMPSETCHLFCLLPGRCTGICGSDADCPADMRCSQIQANFLGNTPGAFDDGPYVDLRVCTYAAGSRTACTAEDDCDATGAGGADEVCWPTTGSDGSFDAICVTPTTAGQPGDVCGDDPTTDDVENRPCDGACIFNRCGGVCGSDADCAGGRCLLVDGSARASNSACVFGADCVDDGDCAAGELCDAVLDAAGTSISMCVPSQGTLTGGATCEVEAGAFVPVAERCDRDCVDTGHGRDEGRCRQPCDVDADCGSADFVCGRLEFSADSRGTFPDRTDDVTATVQRCLYVPGSRDACTADDDCPAGERCVGTLDTTGAIQQVCSTAVAGGGEAGEACDLDSPCANSGACTSRWEDPSLSYCTVFCARDADCPMGLACRRPHFALVDPLPAICMTPEDPRGSTP